jgi:glutathione S-transferase
MEPTLTSR